MDPRNGHQIATKAASRTRAATTKPVDRRAGCAGLLPPIPAALKSATTAAMPSAQPIAKSHAARVSSMLRRSATAPPNARRTPNSFQLCGEESVDADGGEQQREQGESADEIRAYARQGRCLAYGLV